jgi:hypothetical protein
MRRLLLLPLAILVFGAAAEARRSSASPSGHHGGAAAGGRQAPRSAPVAKAGLSQHGGGGDGMSANDKALVSAYVADAAAEEKTPAVGLAPIRLPSGGHGGHAPVLARSYGRMPSYGFKHHKI